MSSPNATDSSPNANDSLSNAKDSSPNANDSLPNVKDSRIARAMPGLESEILDISPWLVPPPGGYPPRMPWPGEPGFVPPTPDNILTKEDRIALLREALALKQNERQASNITAAIREMETKGSAARFYQDGQPMEKYDKSKGPVWIEMSGARQ